MAGAVAMAVVLVVVFPVAVLMLRVFIAALLGGALKGDADGRNRQGEGPNEYLAISQKEAETPYPRAF